MTEYYTNKSDFEKGKNLGFLENNVKQVVDLLNDISKAATKMIWQTFILPKVVLHWARICQKMTLRRLNTRFSKLWTL